MRWLARHFERHSRRPPWEFTWKVSLEGTVLAVVLLLLLAPIPDPGVEKLSDSYASMPLLVVLLATLVFAPVLETLLLQALPIAVCRWLRGGFGIQVFVSTSLFFLMHAVQGWKSGVGAGLVGGFYLAITYAHWREKSRWTALWTTAAAHFIRNACMAPFVVLGNLLQ